MRNAVRCLTCNTVIESLHRHDFKWCACYPDNGDYAVAVDGGNDYIKMSVGKMAVWEGIEDE